MHIRAEGNGLPITIVVTPGQQNETTVFEALMEQGSVKRKGCGRPRLRPRRIVGDKGYSSGKNRRYARCKGMRITIPRRSDEHHRGPFDREIYRQRNRIERLVGRLKQFRRLATRYEKRAANFRAMWLLGAILLWTKFADTS